MNSLDRVYSAQSRVFCWKLEVLQRVPPSNVQAGVQFWLFLAPVYPGLCCFPFDLFTRPLISLLAFKWAALHGEREGWMSKLKTQRVTLEMCSSEIPGSINFRSHPDLLDRDVCNFTRSHCHNRDFLFREKSFKQNMISCHKNTDPVIQFYLCTNKATCPASWLIIQGKISIIYYEKNPLCNKSKLLWVGFRYFWNRLKLILMFSDEL